METLKNFLHPKRKENIRFVLSDSFVDEQGNPLEWEMRQIKAKEGMEISRDCEGAPGNGDNGALYRRGAGSAKS